MCQNSSKIPLFSLSLAQSWHIAKFSTSLKKGFIQKAINNTGLKPDNCYYNGTRLHSTLEYKTPNEYENSQVNACN